MDSFRLSRICATKLIELIGTADVDPTFLLFTTLNNEELDDPTKEYLNYRNLSNGVVS
jgi:hypothetical protein